jgi:hypothetical protein
LQKPGEENVLLEDPNPAGQFPGLVRDIHV